MIDKNMPYEIDIFKALLITYLNILKVVGVKFTTVAPLLYPRVTRMCIRRMKSVSGAYSLVMVSRST
jgi:hypothetical protein